MKQVSDLKQEARRELLGMIFYCPESGHEYLVEEDDLDQVLVSGEGHPVATGVICPCGAVVELSRGRIGERNSLKHPRE